jgi:hypothetical protein
MTIISIRHLCIVFTLLDRFFPSPTFFSSPTDLHGSRRLEFRSSRCASSSCWCCNFFSSLRFRRKALPVRPPRDSWLHVHPLFPLVIYSSSLFMPLLSLLSCSHVTVLILYCPFFFLFFFFFFCRTALYLDCLSNLGSSSGYSIALGGLILYKTASGK